MWVTAPTVASYLQTTKRDAASSYGVETNTLENSCSACGRALLLGWSCEPLRSVDHRQTRQQRISGNATATKCVKCSACGAENTIRHEKRARARNSKASNRVAQEGKPRPAAPAPSHVPVSLPEPTPSSITSPPPPAKEQTLETAQPKPTVRRKARRKNASLQALLANKKQQEVPKSSGFGLDFMDFMK